MRIVIIGAPGSGKGTQSRRLSEKYNVPQISTGDLLRQAISDGSKLGKRAKEAMGTGELVADEIVLELIEQRLQDGDTKPGFILDGFPRNIPQAQALDNRLRLIGKNIQLAINVHVEKRDLIKRLTGRITCGNCGEIYNENTRKPKVLDTCDICGAQQLVRREDDNEETVAARLDTYEKETAPLVAYYRAQQKLRTVKGNGRATEIAAKIFDVIEADLRPLASRGGSEDPQAPEPIRIVLPPTEEEQRAEEEARRKEEEKAEKERIKAEKKAAAEKAREEKRIAAEKAREAKRIAQEKAREKKRIEAEKAKEAKRKAAEKKKADAAKKKAKEAEARRKAAEKKKAEAEKKKAKLAREKEIARKKAEAEKKKKQAAKAKADTARKKAAEKKKADAEKKKQAAAKKKPVKKKTTAKKVSKKKAAKKVARKTAKKAAKKAAKKVIRKVSKKKTAKKASKKAGKKTAKKVTKKGKKKAAKKR